MPEIWIPLLGAAVLQINQMDKSVSDWAVKHTAVYGSQANAHQASDDLMIISNVAYWLIVAVTPSGHFSQDWLWAKKRDYSWSWGK